MLHEVSDPIDGALLALAARSAAPDRVALAFARLVGELPDELDTMVDQGEPTEHARAHLWQWWPQVILSAGSASPSAGHITCYVISTDRLTLILQTSTLWLWSTASTCCGSRRGTCSGVTRSTR